MRDWLEETVETFSEYESPKRYYYWSCLAAVSAIVKDQVFFDRYLYQLFPNIYVLLFGPSAIKKGPPIALAKSIVSRVNNTRIINGRASVEAIIKELALAQQGPGKPILKDSCGFIVSSELSSSIIGSSSSLDIITDLADRIFNDEEWTHRTKGEGSIQLKNPTITWLAGTNEALFREFVPEKNLKGGLIGRTFVISEHKSDIINSLMFPPKIMPDRDKIAKEISHLAKLKGQFSMTDEVRHEFDQWYRKFRTEVMPKLEDDTGTLGRTDDNVLRIAMLISLARRGDLHLLKSDLREAIREVLGLFNPTRKITQGKNAEIDFPEKLSLFLRHLANSESLSDTQVNILRKFTMKFNHEDLDKMITLMERQQIVMMTRVGGDLVYTLKSNDDRVKEYVEQYKKG